VRCEYLRGAPLRNRTVDLLLTIHISPGSLPGKHRPKDSNSACLAIALASGTCDHQAITPDAKQHPVRAKAQRVAASAAADMPLRPGPWRRMPASRAYADGQMTVKRSSPSCSGRP
jgi:hypothetical protein